MDMQHRLTLQQQSLLANSKDQCFNAGKTMALSNAACRGWQRVVESLYQPELLQLMNTTHEATNQASRLLMTLSSDVSTATIKALVLVLHDHLLTHLHLLRALVTWPHQRYELTVAHFAVTPPPAPHPLHDATTSKDIQQQQQRKAEHETALQKQHEAEAAIAGANAQAVR
jgi:hypothetical protein